MDRESPGEVERRATIFPTFTEEEERLLAAGRGLLTQRDRANEEHLRQVMGQVLAELPSSVSETEKSEELTKRIMEKLHDSGSSLAVRLGALVKAMVDHRLLRKSASELVTIRMKEILFGEKTEIYARMFERMTASPGCVSFRVENPAVAGNLELRDLFLLTYYTFLTCRRTKSDNVLSLAVVGESSSGKSRVLEQSALEVAHLLTTASKGAPGCGRFLGLRSKSLLAVLDVPLSHLFGPDMEVFKNLSRGQCCTVKVHSDVQLVSPTFLLVTSNERLFTHKVPPEASKNFWGDRLWSDAEKHLPDKVKKSHLKALRSRFLEMAVVRPCPQDAYDLKHCHDFNRAVAVAALFEPVAAVLNSHLPEDFASDHLYCYCLEALEKNAFLFSDARGDDLQDVLAVVQRLKKQYRVN